MSPREQVRRAARIAGFGALTSAMLPAFLAHHRLAGERDRDLVRRRWVGAWSGMLLDLFGVEVVIEGSPPGPGEGRLVVANHRSTADILVLLRVFAGHMVSRADLAGWPLVGPAARSVGTIFVDRKDAASGAATVRAMRSKLGEGGTVIVFPEGTTFPDDAVRPFHAGAFVAAAKSTASIVPVGLAYETGSGAAFVNETFPQHLSRVAAAPLSRVALVIGAPVPADRYARANAMRDAMQAEVQALVTRARARVDASPRRR